MTDKYTKKPGYLKDILLGLMTGGLTGLAGGGGVGAALGAGLGALAGGVNAKQKNDDYAVQQYESDVNKKMLNSLINPTAANQQNLANAVDPASAKIEVPNTLSDSPTSIGDIEKLGMQEQQGIKAPSLKPFTPPTLGFDLSNMPYISNDLAASLYKLYNDKYANAKNENSYANELARQSFEDSMKAGKYPLDIQQQVLANNKAQNELNSYPTEFKGKQLDNQTKEWLLNVMNPKKAKAMDLSNRNKQLVNNILNATGMNKAQAEILGLGLANKYKSGILDFLPTKQDMELYKTGVYGAKAMAGNNPITGMPNEIKNDSVQTVIKQLKQMNAIGEDQSNSANNQVNAMKKRIGQQKTKTNTSKPSPRRAVVNKDGSITF